jgi:hypothetical protein
MKRLLVLLAFCVFAGCGVSHSKALSEAFEYCQRMCDQSYEVVCFEKSSPEKPICMCVGK